MNDIFINGTAAHTLVLSFLVGTGYVVIESLKPVVARMWDKLRTAVRN